MKNPQNTSTRRRAALAITATVGLLGALAGVCGGAHTQRTFASRVTSLSEPGGYFDTDNLISNERSYLQVLPELQRAQVSGGAYIGVGPDQNFSYISAIRPDIAFIVDIRRDNLLLHLLFKGLFELSATRVEYVALLFGRDVPADVTPWRAAPIERLVTFVQHSGTTPRVVEIQRKKIEDRLKTFGVALSSEDFATLARFRGRFIEKGVDLRFQSAGRPPQSYYPTYGELLTAADPSGRQANFLASEEAYQLIRNLEVRDQIVPVIGDVAGGSAIAAIGRLLRDRHERLSAFYISNVERYLFRSGSFERFLRNLAAVPRTSNAVVIRSVFGPYSSGGSSSHVQRIDDLLAGYAAGRFRDYGELVPGR